MDVSENLGNLVSKCLAEFIGTFAIVLMGCGSIMISERFPGSIPPGAVPLIFGLTVATMIYAVGHISGAHFNPAVSLAFTVARHFPSQQLVAYWVAQFFGAFAAIGLLKLTIPLGITFGITHPVLPIFPSLVWETILTFVLMFVIISVATDTRAVGTMAGTAIGATVTIAAFVGGPLTGASMNPARTLAPALAEGNYTNLWIYFVGPCIGAVSAALTYNFIRCNDPKTEQNAKGCC